MSQRLIPPVAARTLLVILLLLAVGSAAALAQSGGSFDLAWYTVDGGGRAWSAGAGGGFVLGGTTGQPDAGLLAGGAFGLAGGFWAGGSSPVHRVYLPVIVRNFP